jgi:transcriptional regulator with XRE-family HTH domain
MAVTTAVRLDADRLRSIRLGMGLSQTEFAALIRRAGDDLGEPNACGKRLIQKWESGDHRDCRPGYGRALAKATGVLLHRREAAAEAGWRA